MYSAIIQTDTRHNFKPTKIRTTKFCPGFSIYIHLDISLFDFIRSVGPGVECLFKLVNSLFV